MVELLVRHPDFGRRDLSSARVLAAGRMPVPAGLVRRVESGFRARFQISCGQTEACGRTHAIRIQRPA
jgi:acyl-CoA synthetase (AMP-forming)/AMP-acid ligase II